MKARLITGTFYVLILVAFFCLKIFVHKLFFDGLILLFAIFGTLEMVRAFGDKMHISQKIVVITFAIAVVLTYAIIDFVYIDIFNVHFPTGDPQQAVGRNYSVHITLVVLLAGFAILLALLVILHEKVSLESTGYSLLCYLYPTVFLLVLIVCNHLEYYSDAAILFVFIISPFTDSLAFVFGKCFGKYLPAKMAPHVSPKKTIIGGFGGLVGGAIGAFIVFLIYYGVCRGIYLTGFAQFTYSQGDFDWSNLLFFLGIGVISAAFSQFGDLVESAIKRKLGIKDMGKILPGHGGVLDRIDSSLYASLIIALIFVMRIMITGR